MPIKVLIGDDCDMMRRAIRDFLRDHPEVEIVGEARNLPETVKMAKKLSPEVVIMDLGLATRDSLNHKLRLDFGSSQLLAISLSNDDEARDLADTVGANALIDKMSLYTDLVPAICSLATRMRGSPNRRAATQL